MKLRAGVDARDVDPVLWIYLGALAVMHYERAGSKLTVTSLRRPAGPRPSLHSPAPGRLCGAADLRRHQLDELGLAEAFCKSVQSLYGRDLGVVLEPEWLTPEQLAERGGRDRVAPHIHVQLKRSSWPLDL